MDARLDENQTITLKTRRDGDITLNEYVRLSVENYLSQLDGLHANGLYALVISEVEKPLIKAVLQYTNQNQTKASDTLGISRSTLRKKMMEHNIE